MHGDRCINVGGFDQNGVPFAACSVILLQDDDVPPAHGYYAMWMPYQVGQAKSGQEKARVLTDADAAADLAGTPRPVREV